MTAHLDEEKIRDLLLVFLNAQYEGDAAGEVFNAAGKTDILIRVGDRNVFIAECKIWKGPKTIRDALGQLLSYLTWRDTKAALLVFIRIGDQRAQQSLETAMVRRVLFGLARVRIREVAHRAVCSRIMHMLTEDKNNCPPWMR